MAMQSARMVYKGADHRDIYFQGMYHDRMYVGSSLVWEKIRHPMHSQYFMVNPMQSSYGPNLIDEYGVRLDVNEDAIIEKCAVYLVQSGSQWKRTIACKGRNITYTRYVPYLAYRGEIIYDALTTSGINKFSLSHYANDIWNYSNYSTITADLSGADGKDLTVYSIGVDAVNTKLFYNLSEMQSWLLS